jgi:hypothetical protein
MAERPRDSLDSLGSDLDELVGKEVVVHGKTDRRDQSAPLVSLSIVDHASRVSKSDGVSHVDLVVSDGK